MTSQAVHPNNKEKKARIAHIVAGLVILIHAFERFSAGHGPYWLFASAGLVFILLAIFHHRLAQKFPWIDGVFFMIEGVLSLVIAYEYIHTGKKALPFVYGITGVFQIFLAFWKMRYKKFK